MECLGNVENHRSKSRSWRSCVLPFSCSSTQRMPNWRYTVEEVKK